MGDRSGRPRAFLVHLPLEETPGRFAQPLSRHRSLGPEWQPIADYLAVFLVTAFGNFAHGNNAAVMVTVFVMTPYLLIAATRLLLKRLTGPWAHSPAGTISLQ